MRGWFRKNKNFATRFLIAHTIVLCVTSLCLAQEITPGKLPVKPNKKVMPRGNSAMPLSTTEMTAGNGALPTPGFAHPNALTNPLPNPIHTTLPSPAAPNKDINSAIMIKPELARPTAAAIQSLPNPITTALPTSISAPLPNNAPISNNDITVRNILSSLNQPTALNTPNQQLLASQYAPTQNAKTGTAGKVQLNARDLEKHAVPTAAPTAQKQTRASTSKSKTLIRSRAIATKDQTASKRIVVPTKTKTKIKTAQKAAASLKNRIVAEYTAIVKNTKSIAIKTQKSSSETITTLQKTKTVVFDHIKSTRIKLLKRLAILQHKIATILFHQDPIPPIAYDFTQSLSLIDNLPAINNIAVTQYSKNNTTARGKNNSIAFIKHVNTDINPGNLYEHALLDISINYAKTGLSPPGYSTIFLDYPAQNPTFSALRDPIYAFYLADITVSFLSVRLFYSTHLPSLSEFVKHLSIVGGAQ
jgi:hypothetical protein